MTAEPPTEPEVEEPEGESAEEPVRGEHDPFNGIDEEKLKTITQKACARLRMCRSDMGLDFGFDAQGASPIGRHKTWAWYRQIARMEYAGNFSYRRSLGGVFVENGDGGWSMNIPRRFVRLMWAQISDDLVGTDPCFACMPEKILDKDKADLSKQVEMKVQGEVDRSNLVQILRDSIRVALTEGERPIKLTWLKDQTQFTGPATVLVDGKGEPVKTQSGRYVFENDDVLQVVVDQNGDFVRQFDGTPLNPGEAMQGRLEADPSFLMPDNPTFKDFDKLPQLLENKNCLDAAGLFAEDFIYPIYESSLESPTCDIMAHVYDAPLEDLQLRYKNAGYPKELIAKLSATGNLSKAGQPIAEAGEQLRTGGERKLINIHETYYRVRLNDDDENDTWLFLVIDYVNQLCIYADFLGAMKMKRPPFVLLRGLESEPGRAYGVGVYKMFADKNLAIDVWFNRLALKNSKEGSITFVHRDGIEEVLDGNELVIGDKKFYHIPPAMSGEQYGKDHPPVFRINLNEMDEHGFDLIEKMIQSGQLELGIISAADGSSEDLNSSKTATGIRNIERTGNLLQRSTEYMQADDITKVFEMATDMILENMNPEEVEWVQGENRLATMNREDIRNNLPRDVRLLLTKSKSAQALDRNQQVLSTITNYYQMPLHLRKQVRPVVVDILKNLDVNDADDKLEEPTDEEIEAEKQQMSWQTKPVEKLVVDLQDVGPLTPDERTQVLNLFGVKSSDPAAVAQAQAAQNPNPPSAPTDGGGGPTPAPATPAAIPQLQAA